MTMHLLPRMRHTACNLFQNIPLLLSGMSFMYLCDHTCRYPNGMALAFLLLCIPAAVTSRLYRRWAALLNLRVVVATVAVLALLVWPMPTLGKAGAAAVSFFFCSCVVGALLSEGGVWSASVLASPWLNRLVRGTAWAGFGLMLLFCLSPYIWGDTAFSLRLVEYDYAQIVAFTARDVHPPLYYIMLKVVEDTVGLVTIGITHRAVAGKLFSLLACALTALLCRHKMRHTAIGGQLPLLALGFFACGEMMHHASDVRMYGWAMLFVTGAYLYAMDIMRGRQGWRPWLWLSAYTLCAAYTHNFALVAAAALWLCIAVWMIVARRALWGRFVVCAVVVAGCFVPWLVVLLRQMGGLGESYWITRAYPTLLLREVLPGAAVLLWTLLAARAPRGVAPCLHRYAGALVPLFALTVGLAVSLAMRPVIIGRYLLPGYVCLWLTLLAVLRQRGARATLAATYLLLCCSVLSFVWQGREVYSTYAQTKAMQRMVAGMEPGSVMVVDTKYTLSGCTIAMDTGKPTRIISDKVGEGLFFDMFDEISTTAPDGAIERELAQGRTVYYMADEAADIGGEYLGQFLFWHPMHVYVMRSEGSVSAR